MRVCAATRSTGEVGDVGNVGEVGEVGEALSEEVRTREKGVDILGVRHKKVLAGAMG